MDYSSPVYAAVRARLQSRFGDAVHAWWGALPELVTELSARWGLAVDAPVGRGNTSVVLRCRREDGSAAILKLTPDREIAVAEASSLGRWASSGRVPAVWAHDAAIGALLLEAISSEVPLSEGGGDVSLSEVVGLIRDLHQAGPAVPGQGIVALRERVEFVFEYWAARHRGNPDVLDLVPLSRLRRGQLLAGRLVADAPDAVLLHGDCHPGNVLYGGESRGLVAIDPRPCVGDPAFDVVDWVFWRAGPHDWASRSRELASALGMEQGRVWAWCSAFAAMFAASRVARGGRQDEVESLLALAA